MLKKNLKLNTIDYIIILFCFVGALVSGAAFFREYNNTLVKLNEEPVGTIIFKKRVAQRKFNDRNAWDRLKYASFIYNGDTIRTIEQSEAIIIFQDEITHINLGESTMIQILYDAQRGARIDFAGGDLDIISENTNILITSGTSSMIVNGQARMEKNEEGFVLSVSEGHVNFDGMEMSAGNVLALDSYGEINTNPMIVMTSFGSSARILGTLGERAITPVEFTWNDFYFNPDTYVIIEIASDRRFNHINETRNIFTGNSTVFYLENGNYWWRIYPINGENQEPANSFFPSGAIEVIPVATAALLSPLPSEELFFPAGTQVHLSWSAVEGVSSYLIEFSTHADMRNPVVSRRIETNSITQSGLDFGRWFWRITPVFPLQFIGTATPSVIGEFSVLRGSPELTSPVLTFPLQDGKIFLDSAGRSLMWTFDPNVSSWLVELADNPAMTNPLVRQNTTSNHFLLPSQVLQAGKNWYWRITAQGGTSSAVSAVWKFEVSPGSQQIVRPVISPTIVPFFPNVYFDANLNNLDASKSASNNRMLMRIVDFLNENREYRMRIEGHANPIGNPGAELITSLRRAETIVNLLVELGANRDQLIPEGLGGNRPIIAREDYINWWMNRRVEFFPQTQ